MPGGMLASGTDVQKPLAYPGHLPYSPPQANPDRGQRDQLMRKASHQGWSPARLERAVQAAHGQRCEDAGVCP